MPALQVKDCPEAVYEQLRQCAAEQNRSISQQALTIIEGFLNEYPGRRSGPQHANARAGSFSFKAHEPAAYGIEKRKAAFDRIDRLPPLAADPSAPSSVDLLAHIREEEAR